MKRTNLSSLFVLTVFLAGVGSVRAVENDIYWTNLSSVTAAIPFTNATAWSGVNMPPFQTDRAIFGVTNSGTIGFGATGWTITDLLVTNKVGSAGGTYTFLFNSANQTATVYNTFIIGDSGVAGQVQFRASTAGTALTITNNGNGKFVVGGGGNGTLTTASTGANYVQVWSDQIVIGRDSGFTGTVTSLGTRTVFITSNMVVGSSGVGVVDQSANFTTNLVSGQLLLGEMSTGTGSFTLGDAGAFLAVTNGSNAQMVVGKAGAGAFTLTAGNLLVNQLVVATNAGSAGTFTWNGGVLQASMINGVTPTSATDTNALVNALLGTSWGKQTSQTFGFGNGTASLINGLILGETTSGAGGLILNTGGTLFLTNGGTAKLIVGQNGAGTLTLNSGGNLTVDRLFVTNNTAAATNSFFTTVAGTLNTLNGSTIISPSNSQFLVSGTWNVTGGTNVLGVIGKGANGAAFSISGQLVISGTSTVFSNNIVPGNGTSTSDPGVTGSLIVSNGAQYIATNIAKFIMSGSATTAAVYNATLSMPNVIMTIGSGGGSSIVIASNNAWVTTGAITIGNLANGNGAVYLAAGSVWTNASGGVSLSNNGNTQGTLDIASGSKLYTIGSTATIGDQTGGRTNFGASVTVRDAASLWQIDQNLEVGKVPYNSSTAVTSNNTLFVQSGGTVIASNVFITTDQGQNTPTFTSLNTNNGVVVNGGYLYVTNTALSSLVVGQYGHGYLVISNGGVVQANNLTVTNYGGNVSTLNFGGGGLMASNMTLSGALTVGDGTHAATNALAGGFVNLGGNLTIASLAVLNGNGTVVPATTIASGGTLAPGNSLGMLTFSNNLTLAGALNIELQNAPGANGTGDFVNVFGALDVTGATLNFSVLGGTLTNSVYVFGQYNGPLQGAFATTNTVPVNYAFNGAYNGNQLALVVIPEPSGLALIGVGLFGVAVLMRRRR